MLGDLIYEGRGKITSIQVLNIEEKKIGAFGIRRGKIQKHKNN